MQQFISIRSYEALKWIGQGDELRRLSIWIYDATTDRLSFFASNQIRDARTIGFQFEPGKGVIGIVFKNQEVWNEPDGPELPVWIDITDQEARYHGLFCAPITYGDLCLGVLSVDREKKARFDADSENVLHGFAYMIGTVLGNEKTRAILAGP